VIAHLVKIFYAEAAHRNPHGSAKAQQLHGHSYQIEILGSGVPSPDTGWIVDFADMKRFFEPIYRQLDHAYLNELPGLEEDSTLPAVQRWILAQCEPRPHWLDGIRVSITGDLCLSVKKLREDDFAHLPERYRFTFEAAQALPTLDPDHPCTRVHGHSYSLEVGAKDMNALEGYLPALYERLDHVYLNDVEGLECPTCENICAWVWAWMEEKNVMPMVVVVQETPTARAVYYGE